MAAIIEFSIAKLQIRFGYYFYVSSSIPEEEESENVVKRTSFRMKKIVKSFVYINFLAPVIIIMLFINPLSKDILVPDYISPATFTLQKIFTVLMSIIFRAFTFRDECQFQFNESYFLVRRVLEDKNEKIFKYVQLRMKENFFNTWYYVF